MTTLGDRQAGTPPIASRPDADPEALIKEARRLRRRHYTFVGAVVVAAASLIAAGVALSDGGGHRSGGRRHHATAPASPKAAPAPTTAKSPGVSLPGSMLFTQIVATPSGLVLSGETAASFGNPDPTCVSASLDSLSLAVRNIVTKSCDDPILDGSTVTAISTPLPASQETRFTTTLSISHTNPSTGQVALGPVVMTYGSFSDTRPVTAYGGQWMWVYDVDTTDGPELLQISVGTGQVVDTVTMPALYRPLLAADDAGVWVGNSAEGDGSQQPALFFVAANSVTPSTVNPASDVPICWLTAAGTSAWAGAGSDGSCVTTTIERYDDGHGPLFSRAGTYPVETVVGDEADGLWAIEWPASNPSEQAIVYIDPDTGSESVVASLPTVTLPTYLNGGLEQGQGVYFDGALYLLEPPFRKNGYFGYTSIVRVSPPHPG